MRRLLLVTVILLTLGFAAKAQPRSAGLRFAPTNVEFAYQHNFGASSFLEADLGLDYVGDDGFKTCASYNWEFAHPAWGGGLWTWYAGPGVTMGYVCAKTKSNPTPGIMMGALINLGCEYTLSFPLAIAVEMRPQFGYHFSESTFYDAGFLGFIPAVSIKYKF